MRSALIIAAGKGSRLSPLSGGAPKTLVPVLGVPIIDRVLAAVRSVGVTDVAVTVGCGADAVRGHVGDGSRWGLRVRYAANEHVEAGNALSVVAARALLDGEFLLLMGDHLVDERILTAVLTHDLTGSVLLAVDRRNGGTGATHVLDDDHGRVVAIGKAIPTWNATDIGVFWCSPTFLVELDTLDQSESTELADCVGRVEAHTFDIATIDPYVPKLRKPVPPWWVDIDTGEDLATAERLLIDNASKNASDALAHWVHRPIENLLVRHIARRSRITPNQLSVVVNVVAYGVTVLFASGLLLAGSLLSFVVGLADGLDGKLARVKQQVTNVGGLEHAFDLLYEFSWIVAFAWAIQRDRGGSAPLLLAAVGVAVIAFYRTVYDQYGKASGHSLDDAAPFDRHFRRVAGRRNLYNVSILVAVVTGLPLAALWAIAVHASITAAVYSVRTVTLLRRLDRRAASPSSPTDREAQHPEGPSRRG